MEVATERLLNLPIKGHLTTGALITITKLSN